MAPPQPHERDGKLLVSFVAMIFVGLGNKIFQKLQTIPMRNYPTFLNILTTFVYIPVSFAYIVPMIKYGSAITWEQRNIPKRKFAVMGALDSVSGIMQVFAATYLGGSLLILLGQAAIPVSMLISRALLQTKYSVYQYVGAVVVSTGLLIVLGPSLSGSSGASGSDPHAVVLWSVVMIASCVPMCLSSVYKEKALGEAELDPVYLNGWIAVFQLLMALPLTVPAALAGDPPVRPADLPASLADGFKCYMGQNTIVDGPHPDDCAKATLFVTTYLLFNVAYNLLIVLILKFGSANILWLAMTIMVPLGNVAFTLPFMPEHQPLHASDVAGLAFIMLGLFVYRFLEDALAAYGARRAEAAYYGAGDDALGGGSSELKKALIRFEGGGDGGDDTDDDSGESV
ncbi:hypothetical protein PybrP1_009590 [[Pythium] brassicae (nom. inval.)]|nr:hypothetical protein PybrP1_009590 [[Pythium] brassicae (nom. inval.)]